MSTLAKHATHFHRALRAAQIIARVAAEQNTMNMVVGEIPIRQTPKGWQEMAVSRQRSGRSSPAPPDLARLAAASAPGAFRAPNAFRFANGNSIGRGTGYNDGRLLRTMATKEYLG
jgi:hypothetical protein